MNCSIQAFNAPQQATVNTKRFRVTLNLHQEAAAFCNGCGCSLIRQQGARTLRSLSSSPLQAFSSYSLTVGESTIDARFEAGQDGLHNIEVRAHFGNVERLLLRTHIALLDYFVNALLDYIAQVLLRGQTSHFWSTWCVCVLLRRHTALLDYLNCVLLRTQITHSISGSVKMGFSD
jgi:hypothetical protein